MKCPDLSSNGTNIGNSNESYLLRQERDDLSADSVEPLGDLRLYSSSNNSYIEYAFSPSTYESVNQKRVLRYYGPVGNS